MLCDGRAPAGRPSDRSASCRPIGRVLAVSLAGCWLLAGCSMLEPVVAEAPALPARYAQEAASGPRRDIDGWWRRFHDPALDRLVAQAARQNLSIAQAKARLAAGRSQAGAASSLFLPSMGGSGQALAGTSAEPFEDPLRQPVVAGFDSSWDVGLFGLSESTDQAAAASAAIAGDELEAVRIAVTAEVAAAYISLCSATRQRELSAALLAAQERRAGSARSRARIGLAPPGADADGAAVAETQAELARFDARAAALRQQIATLLGTPVPDATLGASGRQPLPPDSPEAGRPADLLRARPDVRAAEQRVLKAAADVGIAKADLYPKLRLGGTIGVGLPSASSPLGLAGGPSLQIPLFDHGRREAAVDARRALLDEALVAYRQAVLIAYQEAAGALANWRAAHAATTRLAAVIEADGRQARRLGVLYREGLADAGGRADADAGLIQAQRRLAAARETEGLATVALYKALGAAAPPPAQEARG